MWKKGQIEPKCPAFAPIHARAFGICTSKNI